MESPKIIKFSFFAFDASAVLFFAGFVFYRSLLDIAILLILYAAVMFFGMPLINIFSKKGNKPNAQENESGDNCRSFCDFVRASSIGITRNRLTLGVAHKVYTYTYTTRCIWFFRSLDHIGGASGVADVLCIA